MDRRQFPRRETREKVLVRDKAGRIVRALLLDSSARGARIEVPSGEALPDTFDLVVAGGERTLACGVVWHVGRVYGLAKLGAATPDGVLDLGSRLMPEGAAKAGGLIKARYRG